MLGGFCVGAGSVLLLSVLGVAVGMTVGARSAIAGPLWAALSLLTGFFVAGLAAAHATNQPDRAGSLIQGTLVPDTPPGARR